jgi:hypothetical protein
MQRAKRSKSKSFGARLVDVAKVGLKIHYRLEHIQQDTTKKSCSIESVQSSKPIFPPHNITLISSIEIILLCVVFASQVVRLTVYILRKKRS